MNASRLLDTPRYHLVSHCCIQPTSMAEYRCPFVTAAVQLLYMLKWDLLRYLIITVCRLFMAILNMILWNLGCYIVDFLFVVNNSKTPNSAKI